MAEQKRHAPKFTPCGAKTRSGKPCRGSAMANGRCRMHGGTALSGVASPRFKTGRWSKYIPARMLEHYEQAADDPELLVLRHDIALIDGRLADLLSRVDKGEAKTLWDKARKTNDKLMKAFESNDLGGLHVGILEMDRIIGAAMTDHEAWFEIHSILEQRRKLVESEQKRLVAAQQMITSEQAMTFVGALLNVVKDAVTDRQTLNKIQNGVNDLLTRSEQLVPANVG